ncbi:E3 ubiquitin protein ligase DRIP2-like isoform X2 [Mangifera indica]|uniref:E3 ubiquitin protein ligase DRIP2-like isoform X2 n=1 Tax=Mangifera indica TaxID=29780 RepID=UPI001CFC3BA4|nr:E3 ubiquitin protein ligase DRIP2-like isoform X2 [Mangifera indica]
MAGAVVKVKREILEACMTCPLCNKLFNEATTISKCLHTFCKKCIYEKLANDDVDYCPVCHIDLGCLPVEKLRADNNLQDIRAKIFPYRRRKVQAPEVMHSVSLPVKRKERSLSSLVVSTPKVPLQTGLTRKRTKGSARKAAALQGCGFFIEDKKEDSAEDCPMSSSSPDSLSKISQNKRQDSCKAEPYNEERAYEYTENDVEMMEGKADLWTPLNCLVEAANRTKSSKSSSQGLSLVKSDLNNAPDSKLYMPETKSKVDLPNASGTDVCLSRPKMKGHRQYTKFHDDKNGKSLLSGPVKRRRLHAAAKKREAESSELCAAAQVMLDASGAKHKRRKSPVWFSLVASEDQKDDACLPQISACYLRIKDGKMPVSFIQKYLVKKLDLDSEAEVVISCRGQPVLPTLQLHNLVDLWFQTASTAKKVPTSVGSSAKDFVMVLSYCRKA